MEESDSPFVPGCLLCCYWPCLHITEYNVWREDFVPENSVSGTWNCGWTVWSYSITSRLHFARQILHWFPKMGCGKIHMIWGIVQSWGFENSRGWVSWDRNPKTILREGEFVKRLSHYGKAAECPVLATLSPEVKYWYSPCLPVWLPWPFSPSTPLLCHQRAGTIAWTTVWRSSGWGWLGLTKEGWVSQDALPRRL